MFFSTGMVLRSVRGLTAFWGTARTGATSRHPTEGRGGIPPRRQGSGPRINSMTSSESTPQDGAQPRRRDARQNRERLIVEARALIAVNGVDASLEEIARRADVGVATLYRNFPTRDDLVRALHDLALAELATVRDEIAAAPTAWAGIVVYTERVAEWLVADPSLPPILRRMETIDPSVGKGTAFQGVITSLVAQAKKDGDLRPDVDAVDLAVLVTMVGSLGLLGGAYSGQWRRQLSVVLDGLRSPDRDRPRLPGRPLRSREFQAAVHGLSRRATRAASRGNAAGPSGPAGSAGPAGPGA
ncbi:TetR/AcrR family transcriptional regulator [Cryobacterium sp. TMT1-21]|uniref:TetR/AcrR family transcriptional regulator n=2 Tax=Microbacteriaceae TaxID=85023 RepID=A0AAQ2C5Z6_9MICO|nr:TetR/AcrR family transcriptional regulator [Cryobacterium shii]TFC82665.1 TetR/AcrR family transcriptional regulator [Cryobacterium sp. TmT2-59]TFD12119.1 TetR/AcrR family transcriptional regulator [Cryobacterium sp. TMT1-21]TFD12272.1 TetR/AcrR family transcriptional regulator [Cryobacterium sp. TMT4-10]TFD19319.1 TetR/AcrR family transcriptional regulator [Cryobacterium sp. TMT2-23]